MEALLSSNVVARCAAPAAGARGDARVAALSSRPAKFMAKKSQVALSARSARSDVVCAAAPEPAPAMEGSDPSKLGTNMVCSPFLHMSSTAGRPRIRSWARAESFPSEPSRSRPSSTSTRS